MFFIVVFAVAADFFAGISKYRKDSAHIDTETKFWVRDTYQKNFDIL